MTRRRPYLIGHLVSIWIVVSILLTSCQIQFEPDIEPLIIEEVPDQSIAEGAVEIASGVEDAAGGSPGPTEPISEFNSSEALALCGIGLSWGDESMGMCLAPGGDTYFAWTDMDNVIRVPADATDINQGIFQQAARDRASAIDEIKSQGRSVVFEAGGFLVSLVAAVPACATVAGCAIAGAALLVTGGLLAESGSSIVDNIGLADSATNRAEYGYCRMTGGTDSACRESAGITEELGGN